MGSKLGCPLQCYRDPSKQKGLKLSARYPGCFAHASSRTGQSNGMRAHHKPGSIVHGWRPRGRKSHRRNMRVRLINIMHGKPVTAQLSAKRKSMCLRIACTSSSSSPPAISFSSSSSALGKSTRLIWSSTSTPGYRCHNGLEVALQRQRIKRCAQPK